MAHDLQYLTPDQHKNTTGFIADWSRCELQKEVEQDLAVWHLQDGSNDVKQGENEFHMLKYTRKVLFYR